MNRNNNKNEYLNAQSNVYVLKSEWLKQKNV